MTEQRRSLNPIFRFLPWFVGGLALLLYAVTLNRWVSLNHIELTAEVTGWEWRHPSLFPLYHLVTFPVRWLSPAIQPVALNAVAAVMGALAVALLVRCIQLLPHDRTRDQRMRESHPDSLLSIPTSWIPPILGSAALALQLSFWENAIAGSGEMLDLLLFAYAVRCLLEFRIEQRESWLWKLSFVYGLSIPNNWAMIAFFPAFLAALIWIRGRSFFDLAFILRMIGIGLVGLLVYLFLPLHGLFADSPVTFGQQLSENIDYQRFFLVHSPLPRSRILLASLFSVVPLLMAGIRWPSNIGDTSAAGSFTTQLMFHVIHVAFLALCGWVMFDPVFSPRVLGDPLFAFLPFYFLSALAIGYFSGYILLVFGTDPERWRTAGPARLLRRGLAVLVFISVLAVPAGLIFRNGPSIRVQNGRVLKELAQIMVHYLPGNGAVLLYDNPNPYQLIPEAYLLAAWFQEHGNSEKYPLLQISQLGDPQYQQFIQRRYPRRFAPVTEKGDRVAQIKNQLKAAVASQPVIYLLPLPSPILELFYTRPVGVFDRLVLYEPNRIEPPPLSSEEIRGAEDPWRRLQEHFQLILGWNSKRHPQPKVIGNLARFYSRFLTESGFQMVSSKQYDMANTYWTQAVKLNPENAIAQINRAFLQQSRARNPSVLNYTDEQKSLLENFRGNLTRLIEQYGPIEEPGLNYTMGRYLADPSRALFRQAAVQFLRVLAYQPSNRNAQFMLTQMYIAGGAHAQARQVLEEIKKGAGITKDESIRAITLEAQVLSAENRPAEAEQLLVREIQKNPQSTLLPETLIQFYLVHAQGPSQQATLAKALQTATQLVASHPDYAPGLLNQGSLAIRLGNFQLAADALTKALVLQPRLPAALLNRAIAYRNLNQLDKAQQDLEELKEITPNLPAVYINLAEVALARKDPGEAIKNLERYLKLSPDDAPDRAAIEKRIKDLKK